MNVRVRKLIRRGGALLAAGAAYAAWLEATGKGIPCVFRLVTGLRCPGCGVSGMLLSLLKLDFAAAFRHNAVLFCMLPFLLLLAGNMISRYVRTGKSGMTGAENILSWTLVGILLVWGVARNIP